MDIFESFATDEALEVEGRWVNLSKTAKVRVARAGNPRYAEELRKRLEAEQVDLESRSPETEAVVERIVIGVLADTVLVNWEGFKFQGVALPYSPANARRALQVKDFRRKIVKLADDFEAYRVKKQEELGNALSST